MFACSLLFFFLSVSLVQYRCHARKLQACPSTGVMHTSQMSVWAQVPYTQASGLSKYNCHAHKPEVCPSTRVIHTKHEPSLFWKTVIIRLRSLQFEAWVWAFVMLFTSFVLVGGTIWLKARVNNLELNWTELNWTELNWTKRDWTELNQTGRNWTELDWTELNWTELNWTERD